MDVGTLTASLSTQLQNFGKCHTENPDPQCQLPFVCFLEHFLVWECGGGGRSGQAAS